MKKILLCSSKTKERLQSLSDSIFLDTSHSSYSELFTFALKFSKIKGIALYIETPNLFKKKFTDHPPIYYELLNKPGIDLPLSSRLSYQAQEFSHIAKYFIPMRLYRYLEFNTRLYQLFPHHQIHTFHTEKIPLALSDYKAFIERNKVLEKAFFLFKKQSFFYLKEEIMDIAIYDFFISYHIYALNEARMKALF